MTIEAGKCELILETGFKKLTITISLETIFDIIEQWNAEGIQLSPPATHDAIRRAEEIIGYAFPSDFKEVYLITDGFKASDWRPNMFSICDLFPKFCNCKTPISRTGKTIHSVEEKQVFKSLIFPVSSASRYG